MTDLSEAQEIQRSEVFQELERIRQAHGGFLRPEDVVEFARDPSTKLHAKFVWDDTEAAKRYRLQQAAHIIRVTVIVEQNSGDRVRAYVSLTPDRDGETGYRAMVDVLSNKEQRAQMIEDAKAELEAFSSKYRKLSGIRSLRPLFREINRLLGNPTRRGPARNGRTR